MNPLDELLEAHFQMRKLEEELEQARGIHLDDENGPFVRQRVSALEECLQAETERYNKARLNFDTCEDSDPYPAQRYEVAEQVVNPSLSSWLLPGSGEKVPTLTTIKIPPVLEEADTLLMLQTAIQGFRQRHPNARPVALLRARVATLHRLKSALGE